MNIDPYYKPFEVQLAHSHAGLRHRRSAHALYSEGLLGGLWDAQFKEVRRCHTVEKYPQSFGQASCLAQHLGRLYQRMVDSWECCAPKNWLFLVGENRGYQPCVTCQPYPTASHQPCIVVAMNFNLSWSCRKSGEKNTKKLELRFAICSIIHFKGWYWVGRIMSHL